MFSMKFFSLIVIAVSPTVASAANPLRMRDLTTSSTLEGCYLINIKTGRERLLDGNNGLKLDADNEGYSIRCDVSSVGRLDNIRFEYDDEVKVESSSPYFMNGDKAAGAIIIPVDYLATCGRKIVTVKGSLNNKISFEETYRINVRNPSGASCDDGSGPVPVPVPVPVPRPVRVPRPVPVPVPVPVRDPSCSARVTGFTLVDAERRRDIMDLDDYSIDDVPSSLSIRADVFKCRPKVVESVLINFDGELICQNFAPYTSFGDSSERDRANSKANYRGKTIEVGHHYIKATPYTEDDCTGSKGRTVTKRFEVTTSMIHEDDYTDDYY